jgi:filamentous hemagglutinin
LVTNEWPVRAFAQKTISPNFSADGSFTDSSVDDIAQKLRDGILQPSDVPVKYVTIDGKKPIGNTRSAVALTEAGIPESKWSIQDVTNDTMPDRSVTYGENIQSRLSKPVDNGRDRHS